MALSKIIWTEDMSVGVDVLDQDHQRLIDLLNQFIQAVDDEEGVLVFDSLFSMFIDYAAFHFSREEEMMEAAGYEHLAAHKQGHLHILDHLRESRRKIITSASDQCDRDVRDFLLNWLQIHIMVKDMDYRDVVMAFVNAEQAAE